MDPGEGKCQTENKTDHQSSHYKKYKFVFTTKSTSLCSLCSLVTSQVTTKSASLCSLVNPQSSLSETKTFGMTTTNSSTRDPDVLSDSENIMGQKLDLLIATNCELTF